MTENLPVVSINLKQWHAKFKYHYETDFLPYLLWVLGMLICQGLHYLQLIYQFLDTPTGSKFGIIKYAQVWKNSKFYF